MELPQVLVTLLVWVLWETQAAKVFHMRWKLVEDGAGKENRKYLDSAVRILPRTLVRSSYVHGGSTASHKIKGKCRLTILESEMQLPLCMLTGPIV
eukprot:1156443-Pelagomonas_calceolata.AAC.12